VDSNNTFIKSHGQWFHIPAWTDREEECGILHSPIIFAIHVLQAQLRLIPLANTPAESSIREGSLYTRNARSDIQIRSIPREARWHHINEKRDDTPPRVLEMHWRNLSEQGTCNAARVDCANIPLRRDTMECSHE